MRALVLPSPPGLSLPSERVVNEEDVTMMRVQAQWWVGHRRRAVFRCIGLSISSRHDNVSNYFLLLLPTGVACVTQQNHVLTPSEYHVGKHPAGQRT